MSIPIFLASDNNYAPFVATTMASILDNTNSFIDFYILDSGINDENQEKICSLKNQFQNFNIEFIKIDTENEFKNIRYKNLSHITLSTFNRFLIPKLKPNFEKIIYLDLDIIVLSDIKELYEINLDNYALGAAWSKKRKLYNIDTKDLMELSDNYKYFNAGVLLLNNKKWIENDILMKLFEIAQKYGDKVLHADETLLNKYFDNNYKILDIKFNYLDYDVINSPEVKPIIRHFATPMKPWNSNYCFANKKPIPLQNFDDFWKYAKMTKFHDIIRKNYDKEINKNFLTKKLSSIVNDAKNG